MKEYIQQALELNQLHLTKDNILYTQIKLLSFFQLKGTVPNKTMLTPKKFIFLRIFSFHAE